jgi:hypothetical protein
MELIVLNIGKDLGLLPTDIFSSRGLRLEHHAAPARL